jgi:Tol biopolymer transport system component
MIAAISRSGNLHVQDRAEQSSQNELRAKLTTKSTTIAIKKLCFERYDLNERTDVLKPWIFLKDFITGTETRLIKGGTPDISPTGKEIAFTAGHMYDLPPGFGDPVPSVGRVDPLRIQVMDLRTRKVRDFQSLAGLRHYQPLWSPDGESIAFVFLNDDATRANVGVMDNATGNWKKISTDVDLGNPAESIDIDCWAADNRSLLFHTFQNIYEVGLDGRLLRKIPTIGLNVTTSDTSFLLSSDKSFLVFNRTDDTARGPGEVLYVFDIRSNKVTRLTPEGMSASSPRWLVLDREILFSCATSDTKRNRSDICRINIDGTGFGKVIEDGDYSSFSTR